MSRYIAQVGHATVSHRDDPSRSENIVIVAKANDASTFHQEAARWCDANGFRLASMGAVYQYPEWLKESGYDDVIAKLVFSVSTSVPVLVAFDRPYAVAQPSFVDIAEIELKDEDYPLGKSIRETTLGGLLFPDSENLHTYAILDPATWSRKGRDLLMDLGHFQIPHRSLFQGRAEEKFSNAAPYIVDMSIRGEDEYFQRMFIEDFWEENFGIIAHSPASIEDLRAACRKLTRLSDQDGKWFYHRFWEPEYFLYFTSFLQGTKLLDRLSLVEEFIVQIERSPVVIKPRHGALRPETAGQTEMDLVFAASSAMVGTRHARRLEAQFSRNIDPDDVYELYTYVFFDRFTDYAHLTAGITVLYCLLANYGADWRKHMLDDVRFLLQNEDAESEMALLTLGERCLFSLKNDVQPHILV